MLLEIWRDYREETDEISQTQTSLPEPPEVRERLKQEIRFFAQSIREKKNGRFVALSCVNTYISKNFYCFDKITLLR